MQIIIPLSGTGQRFINAGYKEIKPLILIDGLPMIAEVIKLFEPPGNFSVRGAHPERARRASRRASDEEILRLRPSASPQDSAQDEGSKNVENSSTPHFIFICNKEHLKKTPLKAVLKKFAPQGKIVGIEPHKKGPVFAVAQAFEYLNDDDEAIVNYCDFGKYWDYEDFIRDTRSRKADGAICAYRGFHPHMLGTTNYAFMRERGRWMQEIQEKKPFTDNRMKEYASDGTYYFKKGAYVKKYFQKLLNEGPDLNGEYYISLVFNFLVKDGLKVSIYEIEHMLQWGEPRDLQQYQKWSDFFKQVVSRNGKLPQKIKGINLIPMAGRGMRFVNEGFKVPKPLIEVSGRPMVIQAAGCFPPAQKWIFICLKEHLEKFPIKKEIRKVYSQAKIVSLDKITEGQACTCELGLQGEDLEAPLFIGASDNGMLWNKDKYQKLMDDQKIDCVVWSFRRHPSSATNPQMYGWIKIDKNNNILGVSVKKPISDNPYEDHAIIGSFYFRKARYFLDALKNLYKKNIRINNEFYVDSCINEIVAMGLKAKVFEVDHYICWGTPNDLRTYEYWQSFFHKSSVHPYDLAKDHWNKELK